MNTLPQIANGYTGYLAAFCEGLRPDPEMWVDEWADQHMIIPKKAGAAEPGPYRTDRTPYAREVMRCLSPRHPCRRVIVMGASQLLKTQVALNWIGASIHQAPANILMLLPTEKLVKRVSHRIGEAIKSVPELDSRVAPPRSRDSRNTIDTKEFDGGTLYMATSRSASNLSEISCRYVYGDEVDRWEIDVGGEGDPIELAETRTSTFGFNAKLYFTSSPTIKGASLIDTLYRQSDQRKYHVPCPHCGHLQPLEWELMHWDDALTRAWYVCPECGCEIDEHHKTEMLANGEWRAQAEYDGQTVGFELSQLYAPLGWTSWLALAKRYVKAKQALDRGDKTKMQAFYNTRLARVFDAADESTSASELKARAEDYPLRTIPREVLVLTAAVDTQPNRLEVMIMGWGQDLERWVIDYQVIWGSTSEDGVWQELGEILKSSIPHASGRPISISATCIDSGGHNTQDVYQFARSRKHSKVLAIKGASRPNRPIISNKPAKVDVSWRGRQEAHGAELWLIGTDTAKDWLATRWMLKAGSGAIHFSKDLPADFYDQITAERRLIRYRKGFPISEWVKSAGDRNEALDLCVYNLAAAQYLGLHKRRDHDWERLRLAIDPPTQDLFDPPEQPEQVQTAPTNHQHQAKTSERKHFRRDW